MISAKNATGKSSVLEAVTLALLGTENIARLKLKGMSYVRRPGGTDAPTEPAEIAIHFDGDNPPVELSIHPKTGRFSGTAGPSTVLLAYGPRRFFSDKRVARTAKDSSRLRAHPVRPTGGD